MGNEFVYKLLSCSLKVESNNINSYALSDLSYFYHKRSKSSLPKQRINASFNILYSQNASTYYPRLSPCCIGRSYKGMPMSDNLDTSAINFNMHQMHAPKACHRIKVNSWVLRFKLENNKVWICCDVPAFPSDLTSSVVSLLLHTYACIRGNFTNGYSSKILYWNLQSTSQYR